MPAIEFSRLRTKIELLGRVFSTPEQFIKELTEFYLSYSDLTFQNTRTDGVSTSHPSYRTPLVLNRELEKAIKPMATKDPSTAFQIIDSLWADKHIEPRQLAASLLGAIPITYAPAVLERIQNWSTKKESFELISYLHVKGTDTLRREDSKGWIQTLRTWITSEDQTMQKMGVVGLLPFIDDPDFENMPFVFDSIQPLLINLEPHTSISLQTVIEKLVERSEMETLYFLKQMIRISSSPDLPRFIRRCLPCFSPTSQATLKEFLREHTSIR